MKDKNNNSLISNLLDIPPKQFTLISTFLGILLIDDLDPNQQNSLGNFIVNIGQSILTSVSQQQLIESNQQKNEEICKQIEELKKEILELEKQLK